MNYLYILKESRDYMSKMEEQYGDGDTSYRAAGELKGIQQLVNDFYDYMDSLTESKTIRALHKPDLSDARYKLSYFLSGWLGGPPLYQEHIGSISIPGFHRKFNIGSQERDEWLMCMNKAIQQQPYKDDFKRYLFEQLSIPAERCRIRE